MGFSGSVVPIVVPLMSAHKNTVSRSYSRTGNQKRISDGISLHHKAKHSAIITGKEYKNVFCRIVDVAARISTWRGVSWGAQFAFVSSARVRAASRRRR